MSYEKFIMDMDNCGAMLRLFNGMDISDESLTQDSYSEAGPGDNFLSTSHTLRHYATANYESVLPDTGPYETWKDNGCSTAEQRANTVYKGMLSQYVKPEIDTATDEALRAFVAEKKSLLPDEWY